MTSERLDDYEEGSWTPAFNGSSSNPTQSYATQIGRYVKIGQYVYCEFDVKLAGSGISAGSGYLKIGGVPFQKANDAQTYGINATFGYVINLSPSVPTAAYMEATATSIYLMSPTPTTGVAYGDAAHVTNSSRVLGAFSFRADS